MQKDDVIYRQDAIDMLRRCYKYFYNVFDTHDGSAKISLTDAEYGMRQLSPAQPTIEPKKNGVWINDCCSVCGYGVEPWNNTPYCPNCGADMRGEL